MYKTFLCLHACPFIYRTSLENSKEANETNAALNLDQGLYINHRYTPSIPKPPAKTKSDCLWPTLLASTSALWLKRYPETPNIVPVPTTLQPRQSWYSPFLPGWILSLWFNPGSIVYERYKTKMYKLCTLLLVIFTSSYRVSVIIGFWVKQSFLFFDFPFPWIWKLKE